MKPFGSFLTLLLLLGPVRGDWLSFRGPNQLGRSDERGLPIRWGPTENVLWKAKLPGHGGSSPVIVGDRVFVTSFTGAKADALVRFLHCFDRASGKLLWEQKRAAILPENDYTYQILQHGFTTSTPCSDGERLYVWFGRSGLYAFDLDGKELWHRELGKGMNTFGSGASPILLDDMLIVNATTEAAELVALDKRTGAIRWQAKWLGDCWATPVVVRLKDGRREIVLNGSAGIHGFDPKTGERLWTCENVGGHVSGTPIVAGDLLYVSGANFGEKFTAALRAGGKGDVTESHVVWKNTKVGVNHSSPLLIGDRLYLFGGQATALDPAPAKSSRSEGSRDRSRNSIRRRCSPMGESTYSRGNPAPTRWPPRT